MHETLQDDGGGADGGIVVDARQVARAGAVTLLAAIAIGVDGRVAVMVAGVGAAVVAWSPRGQQVSLRALLGL
ncbi:MAG: hypothetical protein AAGF02_10345 [Actinomycetota bacterium]